MNSEQKPKRELKPRLRFPEFREAGGWEEIDLRNFLTESRIQGSTGDIAKKITVKLWGRGVYEKEESVRGSENTQYYKRRAGQFIYSKLDFLNQAFGIVPNHLDGFESTVDLPCFDIRDGLNSGFLLEYVKRKDFYKRFGEIADGGRRAKRIQVEALLSFPIILPPKHKEQQKIADCLSSLDALITAQTQKLDALKIYKKGLMQQLFPRESEILPRLRFPEFREAGEWEEAKLGSIGRFTGGGTPSKHNEAYWQGENPFLRYLSNNYEAAARKELGQDYPVLPEGDRRAPLAAWYADNPDDIAEFEKQMRRKVHYVIQPQFLWGNIAELARTQDDELLNTLQAGFKYIENESFSSAFDGLFSEINLASEKLGKRRSDRNDRLCKIINEIAKGLAKFSTDSDTLGNAYEYLIGQFAAGSGKKAGEFYTPQPISSILSAIATLDSHEPDTDQRSHLDSVLDFTCGSGSLLLNVRHRIGPHGIGRIYGQEKNITTYNLARMNMLLHGVKDTEFEIFHGDTLLNEWEYLRETNPAKMPRFDAVVANPPFSYRWEPTEMLGEDVRFKNYGLAPKSAADFAFLLHGFHYLKQDGVMAIILPHGVLFRGGAEARIRTKLLKDSNIDTVIGLPANLFFSTGIPVCILVLKKCKKPDDVLFINAAEHFEKGKRQNRLLPEHIEKIIDTYQYRKEEARYARRVGMEEIEQNDFNLNISRYVSTAVAEKEVDLNTVNIELLSLEQKINAATEKHNAFLKELGLPLLP